MRDISELNPHNYPTSGAVPNNLKILFERVMELQDACEMEFTVTSGLRSEEQQLELISQGKSNALTSKHLAGAAADLHDPDGLISDYCLSNPEVLERIGLWMEHPDHTKGWVHVQIMAPKSGKRVFIP
jgi:hypothetical protein